jgi:hypothetical protein
MTVIAALAWTWRTRRRPLPLAILTIGAAVFGYVLYRTFAPFPAAPFGWVVLAAAGSVMAGAAILLAPGLLTRMRSSQLLAATATADALPSASHTDPAQARTRARMYQQSRRDQCQQRRLRPSTSMAMFSMIMLWLVHGGFWMPLNLIAHSSGGPRRWMAGSVSRRWSSAWRCT